MIRPRSSREPRVGTSKSKKKQGWEALSHNAPHILRDLQLHFKVSTSRLIFIFQQVIHVVPYRDELLKLSL